MQGYELRKKLMDAEADGYCFIKWWRKENDFADYEMIDQFLEHLEAKHNFEGFQLLTMDEMWAELHKREPVRIWMEKYLGETKLHWQHLGSDGEYREDIYRYSPEVLLALFERETRGTTIC